MSCQCAWLLLLLVATVPQAAEPGYDVASAIPWKTVYDQGRIDPPKRPAPSSIDRGDVTLYDRVAGESEVVCSYLLPRGLKTMSAGACYIFHTPGAKDPLADGLPQAMAKRGMFVFCIKFPHASDCGLFFNQETKKDFYAYATSGSFAAVASAWETLKKQFNLPYNRFLLYGYSAGDITVQRFSEEYPLLVAGVVSAGGHSFTQKSNPLCPFLVMHTFGDPGVREGDGLFQYAVSLSNPALCMVINPNWESLESGNLFAVHAAPRGIDRLTLTFADVVGPTCVQGSRLLSIRDCKYVVAKNNPTLIWLTKKALDAKVPAYEDGAYMSVPHAAFYRELMDVYTAIQTDGSGDQQTRFAEPIGIPARGLIAVSLNGAHDIVGRYQPLDLLESFQRMSIEHGWAVVTHRSGQSLENVIRMSLSATPELSDKPIHWVVLGGESFRVLQASKIPRIKQVCYVAESAEMLDQALTFAQSSDMAGKLLVSGYATIGTEAINRARLKPAYVFDDAHWESNDLLLLKALLDAWDGSK